MLFKVWRERPIIDFFPWSSPVQLSQTGGICSRTRSAGRGIRGPKSESKSHDFFRFFSSFLTRIFVKNLHAWLVFNSHKKVIPWIHGKNLQRSETKIVVFFGFCCCRCESITVNWRAQRLQLSLILRCTVGGNQEKSSFAHCVVFLVWWIFHSMIILEWNVTKS